MRFDEGDRVRIDIPDEDDPDHELHSQHGEITEVLDDDASEVIVKDDSRLLRVRLDSGNVVDVRVWDLRPAFDES